MSTYSALDTFLNDKLYPAVYDRLDKIFPELGFVRKSADQWQATNRDHMKQRFGVRPDRVMAYENTKHGVTIHGKEFIPWLDYVHNF